MMQSLRKMLTGISIPQEYVCVALEDLPDTLSVHLTSQNGSRSVDVTSRHIFLGYHPLILAIPYEAGEELEASESEICLSFTAGGFVADCRWHNIPASRDSIARLNLSRIREIQLSNRRLVFYEGKNGWHRLLGAFRRTANDWFYRLKRRPAGNVTLTGNLYDQVRIAYALPRTISLVSVSDGTLMNMFPTDLHGPVGKQHYVSSLRIGGQACEQVERQGKIVISEVNAGSYKAVYGLGKNHMKQMTDKGAFDLHQRVSARLALPLPKAVARYRELEWSDYFEWGIHRIYCYRTLHAEEVSACKRLAHIHNSYAQWRENAGLITAYLFR
jgi:hypothetical protein